MIKLLDRPTDEPLLFPDLTWEQFKLMESWLNVPGVRLSFLNGTLEIRRMPGKKHETVKQRLSTLLDAFLEFEEIDHTPTGSMTLENELENVRREADLSYELENNPETRNFNIPDLAIEIVVTSGGLNKLAAYQKLQIPEVWFWQNDRISLHFLKDDRSGYETILQSRLLPKLNIDLLHQCLAIENHPFAIKTFKQHLRQP
jgi:Uma2 family endonuclease